MNMELHGPRPATCSEPIRRPVTHEMKFYDGEQDYLAIVSDFVHSGLAAGDTVVVIATPEHRRLLDEHFARLRVADVDTARAAGRYIELDTMQVYDSLTSNGWPDVKRLDAAMADLLGRARELGNNVRCIGEIVSVMWSRGERAATIRLEHMLREVARTQHVAFVCLYPQAAFDERMAFGLSEVDRAHSTTTY